jgi:hypothetical protein
VGVYSRALNVDSGKRTIAIRVDHIEGHFIVSGFSGVALEGGNGVRIGDDVLSLDGEDFGARVARLAPRIAASTASGKIRDAIWRALRGAPDSLATPAPTGAGGQTRSVQLRRTLNDDERPMRSGLPAREVLAGSVGYVDLDRLARSEVDAMFETIKQTRAVIFNMLAAR